jgi:hypothetical protein
VSELTPLQEEQLEETKNQFWQALPQEWQDNYKDFSIKSKGDNKWEQIDTLYGVDKDTGRLTELSWMPYEDAIEEVYGHEARSREKYNQDPDRYERLFLDGYRIGHGTFTKTGFEKVLDVSHKSLEEQVSDLHANMVTLQDRLDRTLKINEDLQRRNAELESLVQQLRNHQTQPVAYPERPLFSRRRRVVEETRTQEGGNRPIVYERVYERSGAAAALAGIAAVAASAILGFEIYDHIVGDPTSKEVKKMEQKFDKFAANVSQRLDRQHEVIVNGRNVTHLKQDAQRNRTNRLHKQTVRLIKHSHRHQRLTDASILRQTHDLHESAAAQGLLSGSNATGAGDYRQTSGASFKYEYPWNWASSRYGAKKAEGQLHVLAKRAQKHGHKVRWVINRAMDGSKTEILQLDGTTNSKRVIKILSQYK